MSNDPFQKFQISHLSPSALNLWRDSPGIWALRYVGNVKDSGGASMWRGNAVEDGLAALLRGNKLDAATVLAQQTFDQRARGEDAEEVSGERDLIAPMLVQCAEWVPPSKINATQVRVEYRFDDISVPIIGYVDFDFDGMDIDLKTTKRMPSQPSADHVRQVALYRAARKKHGGILYVGATGKSSRHQFFVVDDDMMVRALYELRQDARSLMSFLARFDSAQEILGSLPMNRENYRFPKAIPADLLMAG